MKLSKKQEWIREFFQGGYSPIELSEKSKLSINTIIDQLHILVATKCIRRFDILAPIPLKEREAIIKQMPYVDVRVPRTEPFKLVKLADLLPHIRTPYDAARIAYEKDPSLPEPKILKKTAAVVRAFWEPDLIRQEAYGIIRQIERKIYLYIEHNLKERFGPSEAEWWAKGVPKDILVDCQARRESDSDTPRYEASAYITLPQLTKIIRHNWDLFMEDFSKATRKQMSVSKHLEPFKRLIKIRNIVMHPERRDPTLEEYDFIYDLNKTVTRITGIADILKKHREYKP
ncbi:MAG: hypothetical protein GY800_13205 [Planctomycetes bacterium]|nr:hypothetical protein [Planctomycetota bacterium]